jgi:prevent-host-death family protein
MRNTAQLLKEKTASLREAKAKLSSLTKQARAGTRVVITNHGTPVADLVQHGTGAMPIRSLKHPGALPKLIRLRGKGPTASELVLLDRAGIP